MDIAAHWECLRVCSSTESARRRQLTKSAAYRGIVYQKQRGVVKCRGREKDGEKLGQRERKSTPLYIPSEVTRYINNTQGNF